MQTTICRTIFVALIFFFECANEDAFAQIDYPTKPIRLLVGFAPGGGSDIVARIIEPRLGETLQQRVVIDNRPGASQIIASELAARATPDGYTIFMASAGFTINPASNLKLPFDPVRDFSAIVMVARAANALVVPPSIPVHSVQDLISLARAKPGVLAYGSGGVGTPSHLSGVLLSVLARVDLVHVPYKGSGQAMTDLLSGQLQMSFPGLLAVIPHIRSGKLIALGVTTPQRSALLPELPTIAESGVRDYDASSWFGLIGPAGIPRHVVVKLNEAINRVLKEPRVRDILAQQGADAVGGSSEEFATTISTEITRWKKLVAVARIKLD